jgi:hypothetical protein
VNKAELVKELEQRLGSRKAANGAVERRRRHHPSGREG